MPKTANKISLLVESQLPAFISDEYELFSKFIQKYYEQLELQGQPIDVANNLAVYRNIDFYESNILRQETQLAEFAQDTDTTITVVDATPFPESGYIQINDEICFYKSRTDTQFLEVSRGVSGNTTLGDLYSESTFVTTQAADHVNGSSVLNISNLFLFALVKSFEAQYLPDFPVAYLNEGVDQRTLIKNISEFYRSKGTAKSIQFLFNCLIPDTFVPTVSYPREHTLKSSESTWVNNYSLKVSALSGNPESFIGKKIIQNVQGNYASAVVDNVLYSGIYDGIDLYELILAEETVNGTFITSSKTKLTEDFNSGNIVNVFSTVGWEETGKFYIENEIFTFEEKNVNQFKIKTRSGSATYAAGSLVYDAAEVTVDGSSILILGVLYSASVEDGKPYAVAGEKLEISNPGFVTTDPKIVDFQNNLRWKLSNSKVSGLPTLNAEISAIFEDSNDYYIASSGFPAHTFSLDVPVRDQRQLRILPKVSSVTTEVYKTNNRDVGIFVNGIVAMSAKDTDKVYNGPIEKIVVVNRGSGYARQPFVLIDGVSGLARAQMAGQVVESIIIDNPGNYNVTPDIEIVSGRNAEVTPIITNGQITSLVVANPGEFYSSPPVIRITDLAGKGRFADYTAVVSPAGQLVDFVQINPGSGYTLENIRIDVIPVGSSAIAEAQVKSWTFNSYKKYQSKLDSNNGYAIQNKDLSKDYGYAYYASPTFLRQNDTGLNHSPILGFAYDGYPIYGAYGHSNPLDPNSSITRMTSSYSRNITRPNGPLTTTYALGTFFEDYTYVHKSGSLDQNNGRFCVTPDYPNGTYAYFITIDSNGVPAFPYILGNNYYGIPRDSNYNQVLTHADLPKNAVRLRTSDIDANGDLSIAVIDEITRGSLSSAEAVRSVRNFSVGSEVIIDNQSTSGSGATAEVSSVKGKQVVSIESQITKSLLIDLSTTAYLFDGDTITQDVTGATGEIVGDVFSGTQVALRNVTGTFSNGDTLSSSTTVLNLILDQDASYTIGSTLFLTDGLTSVIAEGEVLESTSSKNTVKVKLLSGSFALTDGYFLRSSNLLDTTGAVLFQVGSLSEDLVIFTINQNVAILKTDADHGVGIGDMINVDINPSDTTTTTQYYVRSRIYQKIKFDIPVVATVLNDTGIGRIDILNGGLDYTAGTYPDIALLGGSGSNAKATITVSSSGVVNSVVITDKGSGYTKFDNLTIGDTALGKTDVTTPKLQISVDHVGLSLNETKVNVLDANGLTDGDNIKIGNEIMFIVNKTNNVLTVLRGQNNTIALDHFNNAVVQQYGPGFSLPVGFAIGASVNDPVIEEYNPVTQDAEVVFGYDQTLSTINAISLSTVFFDQSVDRKLVKIKEIEDPIQVFEFSEDNSSFTRNPVIDIKNFYKYSFDVSHSSMNGKQFDISPSINYNIVTPEKIDSGSIVDIKLGFGSRTTQNNYQEKQSLKYSKYYYFDKNGFARSETGYFNVVSDPLQGNKTALYVTQRSIVYNTGIKASHDGTGDIKYTSMSKFSIGEIETVSIINSGNEYRKLPIVSGVVPTTSYKAEAIAEITDGSVTGVTLTRNGSNYSKPKAIIDGNALLDVVLDQGKITGILITNPGSKYTAVPTIKIVETDLEVYLSGEDIGVPRNVRIINNGGSYHNDNTLSSTFRSNYIFKVSNFIPNAFGIGETIIQTNNGVETARAKVVSWRTGSNILIVKDVQGLFREKIEILGISRRNTCVLQSIAYTKFNPLIKTYFDNIGSFQDDQGIIGSSNQRLTDSYYYQDYSYVVKSTTSINSWRELIKKTTHPAGFKLFGEVLIESDTQVPMSPNTKTVNTSIVQLWDPNKNKITVVSTKKHVTTSIIKTEQLKVERGVGSIGLETFNTTEIRAKQLYLNDQFDGAFTNKGNLEGKTTFTLVDSDGATITPYNDQSLTITLDGIIQEPGRAYSVKGNKITFSAPPLGPSVKDGQNVPGVLFHCRLFEFKTDSLNDRYLKKIRNIFQRSGTWIDAANQLAMNKAFIQSETLGYIQDKYPNLTWNTLSTKCYRDIGLVIEALEHDLRFGGNGKTIAAAESYFNNDVLSYIDGELAPTIEAYSYATRLCKIAMRNWDFVDRQVSWTPGTNEVTVSNSGNIAIGMKVSAGRAFQENTIVTEIIDGRTIKVSTTAIDVVGSLTQITQNTNVLSGNSNPILQIAPGVYLQIETGETYFAALPNTGVNTSDNAQMTFIMSGLNTGTFYDASTLIEANKVNIQREAAHRIYDRFPNFTYPGVPEEAYRFKDSRRLIYENLQDIVNQTIAELDSKYGSNYATEKCARDLRIVLAAVAEDTGRGGNSATIATTNKYFTDHDALDGERTESIYGFNFARDLCIEAINNRGTVQDNNIIIVSECTNVNSAITTLFGILTDALQNNAAPTTQVNTGIESWVRAEDFCFRDTGILVDAVVYSLRWGGNQKVIEFANAYFNNYKLNHVKNELNETVYAYNVARDLMILAMRNEIAGSTIIAPVKDPLVRIDTAIPYCAEVESAITNYASIIESILEGGPNRIDVTPENQNPTGYWTSLSTYTNKNILPDPLLVNGTLSECEEVASALDSLYSNLQQTLITGPGSVEVSNPDYVDNENTVFDLYYEDGSAVVTDKDENLFISLSGILQHDGAYYIDKTTTPNKIVFDGAPIWNQSENTKTVQEPLAVENIAIHSVGNYIRCKLDTSGILDGSAGPFIILRKDNDEVQNVDDANYMFVFVDGILQRTDSYSINGPALRFTKAINDQNNVELILLYGRELDQTITLHDFEFNTYLNRLTLTISDTAPNTFVSLFTWFNNNYDKETFVYQKDGSIKHMIGKIKRIERTSDRSVTLTVAGQNPVFNGSESVFFSTDYVMYNDEIQLSNLSSTLNYQLDEFGNRRMQRDSSAWLYDSVKADESFYVQRNLLSNLNAGDRIKIDGEKDFRQIKKLPQYVNPKDYRSGSEVTSSYYGSVTTTNYNGSTRGVGLSAVAVMETDINGNLTGRVSGVEWNRKDLQLYYDQGIIQPTTAYGYDTAPVLHFLPVNQQGGGAKAKVIVSKGQIIDIVLVDQGEGYTEAPKIIVSRKYDLIKGNSRKVDSFVTLGFANQVTKKSPVNISFVAEFYTGIESLSAFAAQITVPSNSPKVTLHIEKDVEFRSTFQVSKQVTVFNPTSIGTSPVPTTISAGSDAHIRYFNIDRSIESQPVLTPIVEKVLAVETGILDTTNPINRVRTYSSGIAGAAIPQWRPFQDTGNILSTGGQPITGYTIEELGQYGFTIEDFSNATGHFINGVKWNLASPSINNYLVEMQTSPLPAQGDFTPVLLDQSVVSSSGYPDPTPDGYYVISNGVVYIYVSVPGGVTNINDFRASMTGSDIWVEWGFGHYIGGRYNDGGLTGFATSPYEQRISAGQFDLFNDGSQAGIVLIPNESLPDGIGKFRKIGNYDTTFIQSGEVIYCETSKLPASGTILIGREQISYTSKLSDRLLNCTRGVNNTPIEVHTVGALIRLLP